jgi:histidinol phosphatase-like PHP family hydrolase
MKSGSEIENKYEKQIRNWKRVLQTDPKLKTNVIAGCEIEIENEYEKQIR